MHTNGSRIQGGIFGGYTKNLGAGETIDNSIMFGTRSDIDYVYRVFPRIIINSCKFRIAGEPEYTAASFGKFGMDGTVTDAVEVGNIRLLTGLVEVLFGSQHVDFDNF